MRHASRESAAVATIQNQHLAPRAAARHHIAEGSCRDGGASEKFAVGIGHGKVQQTLFILEAMAGKIEQQQIVLGAVGEKRFNFPVDLMRRLVQQSFHRSKTADGRVSQKPRQGFGILGWCHQLPQTRVLVIGNGDDERRAVFVHRRSLRPVAMQKSFDDPLLLGRRIAGDL